MHTQPEPISTSLWRARADARSPQGYYAKEAEPVQQHHRTVEVQVQTGNLPARIICSEFTFEWLIANPFNY
jgi:hypothetical protein